MDPETVSACLVAAEDGRLLGEAEMALGALDFS